MNWHSRSVIDPTEANEHLNELEKTYTKIVPTLLENKEFRLFMHLMMSRVQYYSCSAELTPFAQGKRAFVMQMIGTLCGYGGDAAKAFMRESASRYVDFTREHYIKKKDN